MQIIRIALLIALGLGLFFLIGPFKIPILLAAVFALAFNQPTQKLQKKMKSLSFLASFIMVLTISIIFLLPLTLAFLRAIHLLKHWPSDHYGLLQTLEPYTQLPTIILGHINHFLKQIGMTTQMTLPKWENYLPILPQFLGKKLTQLALSLPWFLLSSIIFILSLYQFLANAPFFKKLTFDFIFKLIPNQNDAIEFRKVIYDSCQSTLVATVLIGFLQATTMALGAQLLKIGDMALIFTTTFLFSFIPFVGSTPITLFMALWALAQNRNHILIFILILGIIVGLIDNILRPIFFKGKTNLHPVLGLLAVLGGLWALGPIGPLLGPLIMNISLHLFPVLVRQINLSFSGKRPRRLN